MALSASAALTVSEKDGELTVLRDGRPFVRKIVLDVGPVDGKVKRSFAVAKDGARVWNRWCEDRAHRFRFEAVSRPDGSVELSLLGEMEAPVPDRRRMLRIDVGDGDLLGSAFSGLAGNGRKWNPVSGVFCKTQEVAKLRWLSAAGVTFDFNSTGPGETDAGYTSRAINGVWTIARNAADDGFEMFGGGEVLNRFGGFVGTKLVLREGADADYPRIHFLRSYHYPMHLNGKSAEVLRVCFGAPKHGADLADGHVAFTKERGFGWVAGADGAIASVGHGEGAYYSNVSGSGRAVYRIGGLHDGFYLVTLHCGNWTGRRAAFVADVNGIVLGSRLEVPEKKARTISRAVRITGGKADFALSGDWLVSAISVQPLMSDEEDFSVRRAFWYVEGYEPSTLYRSADYEGPCEFPAADEIIDMPPPGGECAGECGRIETPVDLPDITQPRFAWLRKAKTYRFLNNNSTLAEMDDPKVMKDYLDSELAGRDYASAMISGMHSRHTYRNHVQRGIEAVGRMCAEFHRRGIKVFDHHDVTLCWNFPAGFRVLMELPLVSVVDITFPQLS